METIINKLPEDINYMFYIKPKGAKRFSTYNPSKGTMGTGLVFTELYRKEHLLAVCKWIAEDNSGDFAYQLRSGGGKKIYWEHNPMAATPAETPQISTGTAETANVSADGENAAERAKYRVSRFGGYKIIVGDRVQGKVIAVLMSVNGHNTIEINDESEHIATMGEKPLQIDKPIMQLSDSEVLELIYNPTEPPQSHKTPQATECTSDSGCRVCSHCGKHFHEGWFLGNEYACSEECAVALYGGDRELFEADLETEENEPGTTECYWSVW